MEELSGMKNWDVWLLRATILTKCVHSTRLCIVPYSFRINYMKSMHREKKYITALIMEKYFQVIYSVVLAFGTPLERYIRS
ncbi:hypothetical protein D3C72_1860620 [compost metagenome]